MSKPYSGSPSLSRSGSPPLLRSASSSSIFSNHAERRTDDEKTMANLGGAPRPASPTREKEQTPAQPTSREQILPILNYCAASIMMTVVNKVSSVVDPAESHSVTLDVPIRSRLPPQQQGPFDCIGTLRGHTA